MSLDPNDTDSEEFLALTELLELGDETAEGRAAYPLSQEDETLLLKLIEKRCSRDERRQAMILAASNRLALEFLAVRIKNMAA
ncbi:MAG: hypothetical protein JNJ70_08610 [Verrucomicrobiales bacterium]|nr:hypothetical protein [Verrucomicrobiales bacterium]